MEPVGFTITQPGRYRLATSIENCNSSTAISIQASNVHLDLAGRRLDGTGGFFGIRVMSGESVTISDGAISDFNVGVEVKSGSIAKGLTIRAAAAGALASGAGTITSSTIIGGTDGIVGTDGATAIGNTIGGQSGRGIEIDDENVIRGNVIIGTGLDGILAGNGNVITANRIEGSEGRGITAGNDNRFIRNKIIANSSHGIRAFDDNVLKRNVLRGNFDGTEIEDGNRVLENRALGNLARGIDLGANNVVRDNKAHGNEDDGLFVGTPNAGTILEGNVAKDNGAWGIDAADNPDIRKRRANVAKGNGEADQCSPKRLCK